MRRVSSLVVTLVLLALLLLLLLIAALEKLQQRVAGVVGGARGRRNRRKVLVRVRVRNVLVVLLLLLLGMGVRYFETATGEVGDHVVDFVLQRGASTVEQAGLLLGWLLLLSILRLLLLRLGRIFLPEPLREARTTAAASFLGWEVGVKQIGRQCVQLEKVLKVEVVVGGDFGGCSDATAE